MKSGKTKKIKNDIKDDKEFKNNAIYHYPQIREFVIGELGDGLRNLSPKRKEKLIQRGVLIYIKASNNTVHKALDVIYDRIKKEEDGAAQDRDIEVKE